MSSDYLLYCLFVLIDRCHSAALLSLGETKTFALARQASARREFRSRLTVQNKAFYSPETQHGRRVIRVSRELATTTATTGSENVPIKMNSRFFKCRLNYFNLLRK